MLNWRWEGVPQDLFRAQVERQPARGQPEGSASAWPPDLTSFIEVMTRAATTAGTPEAIRAEIGAFALSATTPPEADLVALFARMVNSESWPERRYLCTAVDALDGSFVTWDRESGVELSRAVASSCAVPGIFPPVSIKGRRYMDGGMRSGTNADLAKGHDRVLIIALAGGAGGDARADLRRQRLDREIDGLTRAGSTVELIVPDEESVRAIGLNPMDGRRSPESAAAGARQAKAEAARIGALWR